MGSEIMLGKLRPQARRAISACISILRGVGPRGGPQRKANRRSTKELGRYSGKTPSSVVSQEPSTSKADAVMSLAISMQFFEVSLMPSVLPPFFRYFFLVII